VVPFRPVRVEVSYGEPQLLVKAGPGDCEIQVSCSTFGASGVAGGPNYIVGVQLDDGTVAGVTRTQNEFTTDLEDGDELWVAAAEDLAFTTSIVISGLVRSQRDRDGQGKD
jgi:hypothetical protein